ncbi:MAG TPA: CAP domain-containing protein [Terriglobales bacterium]|nr:CAP domain-containing protein [Terriglobales bacterium]
MVWALIASLAIVFSSGAVPLKIPLPPASAPAIVPIKSSSPYDPEAERQLLVMANQARAQAGLPPLQLDEGLTQAARAHAAALAARQQLSHQLPGEPSLAQRLAASSTMHLDRAGENVSFAPSVDQAQQGLMRSPPHRENLLNAAFNVAGFGVVRNGYTLYVAQDFGHGSPTYPAQTSADIVAASVSRMRGTVNLPQLRRLDSGAQAAACSMARENSLHTPLSHEMAQSHYLLRYTSDQPETLPSGAGRAVGDRDVRAFSVGSCYARTASYPNGVYWVTVLFY